MRAFVWTSILVAIGAAALVACSSSDSAGTGGAAGGATGGTAGATGGTGGAADGGTGGGTGGAADGGTGGATGGTGGGTGGAADGGMGGTTGGTGGAADGGTGGGTGGTGGGADCTGILTGDCGVCAEGACCAELAACAGVAGCLDCLADETTCDATSQPPADAVLACAQTNCDAECFGGGPTITPACDAPMTSPSNGSCVTIDATITCNPVTNEGCDTAGGQACDVNSADGYECYDPPNENALCAVCSDTDGYCAAGMTCAGTCAKYCCGDGDCGTGTCDLTLGLPGGVGLCVAN